MEKVSPWIMTALKSVRDRRVGPRFAEGSEAGLVQVIAARVFKRSRVDGPVRSSRATATT
jgi:hypothetical protein